jgi:23S rRNA (adenine1618-N6)-methyltransferase
MSSEKSQPEKSRLHSRNKNRERYDLSALIVSTPELKSHIVPNRLGADSVDFSSPVAVKLLNKALLHHYYGIENWDFPNENLCPPIPGRAEYIHYIADTLSESNYGKVPKGEKVTCLDVGVGASCIYPILGVTEYGWNFIGADINPESIKSAENIVNANPTLKGKIECRLQKNAQSIFFGAIRKDEKIDAIICNPPFHSSMEDAQKGTQRKVKNLSGEKVQPDALHLAGINKELVCEGGESKFIQNMIKESEHYAKSCFWFSTLVSKQSNLKRVYKLLDNTRAVQIKTIPLGTGNKSSRIVAWSFLSKVEQKEWRETRWK